MVKICSCTCAHITGYIGTLLFLLGLAIILLEPSVIKLGLQQQLTITEGTLFYEQFLQPTLPIYLSVWIWTIQNADDYTFTENDRIPGKADYTFPKPFVKQIGPFVYKEIWEKDSIVYKDDEGLTVDDTSSSNKKNLKYVQGRQKFSYESVYDPAEAWTGLDPYAEENRVNVSSILALGLPNIVDFLVKDMPFGRQATIRSLVNQIMNRAESLPVLKNLLPQEALFGYEDPLLEFLYQACQESEICQNSGLLDLIPTEFGILTLKDTSIGWHYTEWNTGVNDINDYGQITKFKLSENDEYSTKLNWWPSNEDGSDSFCQVLKGTDGTSMTPYLEKDEAVWLFSADIFRSIFANYTGTDKSPEYGMEVYTYEADSIVFAPPKENPDNSCFCKGNFFWDEKITGLDCNEIGGGIVIDEPNFGIPLLVSLPHFLDGNIWRNLTDPRSEFQPSQDEHVTQLAFEPLSGTAITAGKKLQQSVVAVKTKNWDIFNNIQEDENGAKSIVMPLVWVNESVVISPELEKEIYISAVIGMEILLAAWISFIVVGVLMIVISCYVVGFKEASCRAFCCCESSSSSASKSTKKRKKKRNDKGKNSDKKSSRHKKQQDDAQGKVNHVMA